jgi:hypothetical protein
VIDILKDANPFLVLIVLVLVVFLAGWMFRRLVTANDKVLREIVSDLRTVKDKVGILETTDATRQRSMSDGANKFAKLEAADTQMQERYIQLCEKLTDKYIDKGDCQKCAAGFERALTQVDHKQDEAVRTLELFRAEMMQKLEPVTRMLAELVGNVGVKQQPAKEAPGGDLEG